MESGGPAQAAHAPPIFFPFSPSFRCPALGRMLAGAAAAEGLGLTALSAGDCGLHSAAGLRLALGRGLGDGANRCLLELRLPGAPAPGDGERWREMEIQRGIEKVR